MTDDGPRPVNDSLARISRDFDLAGPDAFGIVVARWAEVVGPAVAARARARSLRGGVLAVTVDDGGWATQLRYSEADVIARFAAFGVPVDRLRVTVGRDG